MAGSIPIEPGWYLARSRDVGEVDEWGPRLAAEHHSIDELLDALADGARLDKVDEQALALVQRKGLLSTRSVSEWHERARRCRGLLEVHGGLTVTVELTKRGHLALAVVAAVRRARMA